MPRTPGPRRTPLDRDYDMKGSDRTRVACPLGRTRLKRRHVALIHGSCMRASPLADEGDGGGKRKITAEPASLAGPRRAAPFAERGGPLMIAMCRRGTAIASVTSRARPARDFGHTNALPTNWRPIFGSPQIMQTTCTPICNRRRWLRHRTCGLV